MNNGKLKDTIISWSGVVLIILLWQLGASAGLINVGILSSPLRVAGEFVAQFGDGSIFPHIGISLFRVGVGFVIGAGLGLLLGLAMGYFTLTRQILNPIIEILRPIPPLAWIPLAIIWFGIGENSKLFLLALAAFFPIVVNTTKGVRNIDIELLQAALSYDVSRSRMLTHVALPAAMPDIATGLRVGWSLSFAVLVAAEMIAAESGLGFLIVEAMNIGDFDRVVFGILAIGILSVVTDFIWLLVINRYLLFWLPSADGERGA